jgi:hypothetical protein
LSQESVVNTPESGINAPEERDENHESSVRVPESGVMTQDYTVRSRDTSVKLQELGVTTPESGISTIEEKKKERHEPSVKLPESRVTTQESVVVTDDIVDQAVAQAMKSPKISLYSPLLLAVLESQQLMLLNRRETTLLQYRKSTKARELVENALKEAYPELCEKILKRISEGNGKQ